MRSVQSLLDWLAKKPRILDGGLATELERAGLDLADPLWSARVLLEQPQAIEDVHRAFLEAGAEVLISASYQATFEGLLARGVGGREAESVFHRSVELAIHARDSLDRPGRDEILVAASIGPYGLTYTTVPSFAAITSSG